MVVLPNDAISDANFDMSLDRIALFLIEHTAATCFLAAFLWGNSATLVFAVTAGMGVIDPVTVFVFSTIGNHVKDTLFFFLGRTHLVDRFTAMKRVAPAYERLNVLRKKYARHDLKIFILIKFMYGLRLISMIYFGSINYPFVRYLAYNSIALAIINALITVVGWALGRGVGDNLNVFENAWTTTAFLAGSLVCYGLLRTRVRKWLERMK
ncbi:MAG: membrane protein DedA with SNARE-associated domain [Candidatus Binatia bacterium]|jgi:membrane protein DedA with SNARE-associated domain